MRRPGQTQLRVVVAALAVAALVASSPPTAPAQPMPPATAVEPVEEVLHGVTLVDRYRWLEDQHSPQTRAWIDAQNRHAEAVLGSLPLRAQIAELVEKIVRVDSAGAPAAGGGRYFYSRQFADRDLPVLCLRAGIDAEEEILLDPLQRHADGSRTFSLLHVAKRGNLLAYGVRAGGEDEVVVRFFDVDARADLPAELPRGRYFGVSLSLDQQWLYYSRHGAEGSRVYRRAFGRSLGEEQLVFGEQYDSGKIVSASLADDGDWLVIHVAHGSAAKKTEIFAGHLAGDQAIRPVVTGIEARFGGEAIDHRLIVETDFNAPRGRILEIDLRNPAPEAWRVIVPERRAVLRSFALAGGRIYANYLDNVASSVAVFDLDGNKARDIAFEAPGTISGITGQWQRDEAFFAYSSYHIPPAIYREETSTGRQSVWSRASVPVDSQRYEVRQVFFESKDKTKIPMFLVHRRGLKRDGGHPTLLYGYGGFKISQTPVFTARAMAWLELGGVYAVANLRGGGEFGEEWHEAGMGPRKQNVFDDFLAAAAWLIEQKYTRPERLAIAGGSNGGLLVGAALTQRPDLFRAVICSYPLLDMVRYHKFLVARFWIPEYGSADDPMQFQTLLAYSPYHRVRQGEKYPAVLLVTGDSDTRVDPLHARKMAALLQASTSSGRPVLLRYDTRLGHTGARPISQTVAELSLELAFLCRELDLPADPTQAEFDGLLAAGQPAQALRFLFDAEWEWSLRQDPAEATALGDKRYDDRWPDLSHEAVAARQAHRLGVLKLLDRIDPARLEPEDRLNYRLFRGQIERDAEEFPFLWHLAPINPRDGIQDAGSLHEVVRFETPRDYQNWLARLRAFPRYMDQTIELLREGLRQRVVQPAIVMQRVPAQIRKQQVADPRQSQFFKPFLQFPETIPQDQRQRLTEEALRLVREQIVPAYKKLGEFFEQEYLPGCLPEVGAWQLPRGEEFYALRARRFTTTNLTPRQIHDIGLAEVARIKSEMDAIVRQVGFQGSFQDFLRHLRTSEQFHYKDPQELLAAYRTLCKRIDPELPRLFRKLPRIPYGVEPIPDLLAPDTTTAYYRPPSADGLRAGVYFVNLYRPEERPKYEMEALSLHEAVPGHHLQIALATELDHLPKFRRFLGVTAYVEGWALYAESLGSELGCYRDPYSKFGQLTYEMWRAVRLVVDTGMHAFRWNRRQAIDYFTEHTAKTELDIANEVDRYISWPGQALAYKIGELKIKELRARAEKALGQRFDLREFHDVVLGQGALPLDVLEAQVEAWLSDKLASR